MKTLTLATDNELIRLFQKGNNEALETLVNRHKDKLFTSILMLVKDKYVAEDLFQEVFFQIIDLFRSDVYNEEAGFLPWATRIAYNLCIDYNRTVEPTPIIKLSDNNEVADLCVLLPEDVREVIVLRHFGNISFREIVAMTKSNIHKVIGRMRDGLFSLEKMMEEKHIAF
jgi:RNA polymerase sigma-70 factor (ECF subfamily)